MASHSTWRWIDSGVSDGATQMAIDLAVLENAEQMGMPTVRVYQWKPFCISLGHHQSVDEIDLKACRENHIDVVKRPTGGRAVFHAEEITYSVIIPKNHPAYQSRVSVLYNQISQALVSGLQEQNIPAVLTKQSLDLNQHYKTALSASCFSAAARHEVLLQNKKLIGSAQRHLAQGVLQHGSILTGEAHLDLVYYLKNSNPTFQNKMKKKLEEKTITLNQYHQDSVSISSLTQSLKKGFQTLFSIQFQDGGLTQTENKQLERFKKQVTVFSSPIKRKTFYQKAG